MNVIKLARKYPQFGQDGVFALQDTFNRQDEECRGYLDEATAIKTAQQLERKPYDEVRAALKQVELDSSRRVELDDFVDVCASFPLKFCCPSKVYFIMNGY
jgi:plastin-1